MSSGLFLADRTSNFHSYLTLLPPGLGFAGNSVEIKKTQPFPAVSGASCFRYAIMTKAHLTEQEEHGELIYPTKHSGNDEGGSRIQHGVMERMHPRAGAGINSFTP